MKTFTYTLVSQPNAHTVLNDFATSYWLKNAIRELYTHDVLDALRDIEVLHAIFKKRFEDLTV